MNSKDIRRLKKINQELKRLNKAKMQFVSVASHQLRTPPAAIRGYLTMFLEGDYGHVTPRQEKVINTVLQSTNRLARLVDTLLDVSRIESGRLDIVFRKVDIVNLLAQKVDEFKSEAATKHQRITFKKPHGPVPKILADSGKPGEVFSNLIDNAIKYTPPKGSIRVSLRLKGSSILIKVRDTGLGIPQEEAPRLFERFARGRRGARVHPGGTGLGLYIVKKLIQGHKGKVWVKSTGLNKGAAFLVQLSRKAKGIKENSVLTLKAEDPPAPQ